MTWCVCVRACVRACVRMRVQVCEQAPVSARGCWNQSSAVASARKTALLGKVWNRKGTQKQGETTGWDGQTGKGEACKRWLLIEEIEGFEGSLLGLLPRS